MNISNLASSLSLQRGSLRKTISQVRQRDGTVQQEVLNSDGQFQVLSSHKQEQLSFLKDFHQGYSTLAPFVFDHELTQSWIPFKIDQSGCAPSADDEDKVSSSCLNLMNCSSSASNHNDSASMQLTFSLATYNVWFSDRHQLLRAQAMLDLMATEQPDVICFQEVTKPFLDVVLQQDWIRKSYWISDANGNSCIPYGVILLCSRNHPLLCGKPLNRTAQVPSAPEASTTSKSERECLMPVVRLHMMPSQMGRRLLVATFPASGLRVSTAHLESLNNASMRVLQLREVVMPQLQSAPATVALFAGDTNFHHHGLEDECIRERLPHVSDLWVELHGEESALTTHTMLDGFPGRLDKVYLYQTPSATDDGDESEQKQAEEIVDSKHVRFDENSFAGTNSAPTESLLSTLVPSFQLKPVSIQIIGSEPCAFEEVSKRPIFCSDHVGLLAKFSMEM